MSTTIDGPALVQGILARKAQTDLDAADAAYTLAVQDASRTNNWGLVQAAAEAVHQARAALRGVAG